MGQDSGSKIEQDMGNEKSIVTENPERESNSECLPLGLERPAKALLYYVASPTRRAELKTAGVMFGAETVYDIRKTVHVGNEWGNEYDWSNAKEDNVGPMPSEDVQDILDPLGDVWEISVGQTIVRAALSELNRRAGKELIGDEPAFWISLLLPLILKSSHSLGLISIFGIHDRMDNPAPHMLIGQGLAAAALIRAHYVARKKEISNSLGIEDKSFGAKLKNVVERALFKIFDSPDNRVREVVNELAINSVDEKLR